MSTVTPGFSAYGTLTATRKGRLEKHRLNRTIQATATVQAANATVAVATDAINTVRQNDRVPSTLPEGKRTGRVRRLEQGAIATFGTIVPGSGYTNGSYTGVALRPVGVEVGFGATANITVAGGVVTVCTLVRPGQFYSVGTVLTAILPAGSGFQIPVATITLG